MMGKSGKRRVGRLGGSISRLARQRGVFSPFCRGAWGLVTLCGSLSFAGGTLVRAGESRWAALWRVVSDGRRVVSEAGWLFHRMESGTVLCDDEEIVSRRGNWED